MFQFKPVALERCSGSGPNGRSEGWDWSPDSSFAVWGPLEVVCFASSPGGARSEYGEDEILKKKLYVGNLAFSTDEAGLRELFEQYGATEPVAILLDREPGRSPGSKALLPWRTPAVPLQILSYP